MRSTNATVTRARPLITSHLATPPPAARRDLLAGDTVFGWIDGMTIGFRGFRDEAEAVHAAWVAYRTMSRRFAREGRRRPLPIDTEPMSLERSADVEHILAAGRPIGTLVRPGPDSHSGPDSFGFELQLPRPADELTLRSTAHLLYLTLRRSGIRWGMWAPAPRERANPATTRATDLAPAAPATDLATSRPTHTATVAAPRRDVSGLLGTVAIVLALLTLVVLPAITATTMVLFLGGAAALAALAAGASLAHLVVTDVRDAIRARRPRTPGRPLGGPRSGSTGARAIAAPSAALAAGRRSVLGSIAVLSLAALVLALVVRSPRSVPLLVGVGVSGILVLRVLVMPSRRAR